MKTIGTLQASVWGAAEAKISMKLYKSLNNSKTTQIEYNTFAQIVRGLK